MCRLLAYLGRSIQLDRILSEPEHSLIVQSYQPRKMQTPALNADGLGLGWYDEAVTERPYRYRQTVPVWRDANLPDLVRYIHAPTWLASVQSATPDSPVIFGQGQPFAYEQTLFLHDGFVENFRQTLRHSVRSKLSLVADQWLQGHTDAEYLSALILTYGVELPLVAAMTKALGTVTALAQEPFVSFTATMIISQRDRLVACRYANVDNPPTLYWIKDAPDFPDSVILASEPLFPGSWTPCPPSSILTVEADLDVQTTPL